jgi:hypothetical protein
VAKKDDGELVSIRRAPKLAPFVVLGAGLGFIITLALTSFFPSDPTIGFAALSGYFSIFGVTAGITIGILWWLILDLRSRRREKQVRMEREKN